MSETDRPSRDNISTAALRGFERHGHNGLVQITTVAGSPPEVLENVAQVDCPSAARREACTLGKAAAQHAELGSRSGTASRHSPHYLRRKAAARYIREAWGLPCQPAWLAKLAVTGDGPVFRKCGRFPIYAIEDLDAWAQGRLSAPMRSTSDAL